MWAKIFKIFIWGGLKKFRLRQGKFFIVHKNVTEKCKNDKKMSYFFVSGGFKWGSYCHKTTQKVVRTEAELWEGVKLVHCQRFIFS